MEKSIIHVLGGIKVQALSREILMIMNLLFDRKLALKFSKKTRSKYTTFNRINNYILDITALALLGTIFFRILPVYAILLYPIYIIITVILNVLDYRERKKQFEAYSRHD